MYVYNKKHYETSAKQSKKFNVHQRTHSALPIVVANFVVVKPQSDHNGGQCSDKRRNEAEEEQMKWIHS